MEKRTDVPADPVGLALSADDKTLVVTSAWAKAVTVFDAASMGDPQENSSGYGGGNEGMEAEVFHVPVIDEDAAKMVPGSMRLSAGLEGPAGLNRCSLPRAAAVGKAGLFVTCVGENVVAHLRCERRQPS